MILFGQIAVTLGLASEESHAAAEAAHEVSHAPFGDCLRLTSAETDIVLSAQRALRSASASETLAVLIEHQRRARTALQERFAASLRTMTPAPKAVS